MATLAPTYTLAQVTTGTGMAVQVPQGVSQLRIDVIGTGTISGGTLVLEEAPTPNYAGTWSALSPSAGAIAVSAVSGGAVQAFHFLGVFGAVRGRVSSNVTGGGTITVAVVGA